MRCIEPTIVRRHFVFVQESKNTPIEELENARNRINASPDDEIKSRITEEVNQIFNYDNTIWHLEELKIPEIFSHYDNLQGIRLPQIGMNYTDIITFLKQKNIEKLVHKTLEKIKNGNIERIKKVLPIFVKQVSGKKYAIDGQSRITTLGFHGEKTVSAYVFYGFT